MAAYLIAICRGATDRRGLEEYWERVMPTFQGIDIKPLAVYSPFKVMEGKGPVEGIVMIEFPDMDTAASWYQSPAYQKVRPLRTGAADVEFIFLESGIVPVEGRMPHIKHSR